MEELYTRKLRFAEQQRDESIKVLNVNRVEMAGYAARFDALDVELARGREALAAAQSVCAATSAELAQHNSEIDACRAVDRNPNSSEIVFFSPEGLTDRMPAR